MDKIKVSVIIPTYNASKTIDLCLASILKQDFPDYEVIVVDDGSSDDTREKIKKYRVRLISKVHMGTPAARNTGFKASKGDILVFVDSDCVAKEDLIAKLIEPLKDSKIGVTQPWWEVANEGKLIPALIFKTYEYFTRNLKYPDFLWFYCFAIKRELLQKLGMFDVVGWRVEDVDFSYKVIKEGCKIYLMKEVTIGHFFRETLLAYLKVHIENARERFVWVNKTREFTDQRANIAEYMKLGVHALMLLTIFFIPLSSIPFLALLVLSLTSHLPIAFWAMKDSWKYILIVPFEFITKLSWVLGSIAGLVTLLTGKRKESENKLVSSKEKEIIMK